jgi:hypothetical protein
LKAKLVMVSKRGSNIIPKELIESLGVAGDEKFTVRKTKAGIALKKFNNKQAKREKFS